MSPFQLGDLVIVAYPPKCCGDSTYLGMIFKIGYINNDAEPQRCVNCRTETPAHPYHSPDKNSLLFSYLELKRIPPIIEEEEHEYADLLESD